MMLTRASGVAFALSLSFLETYETSPLAGAPGRSLPGAAVAASGSARASTAIAVTRPRPPLPQRAFERNSPPRFPEPHRALLRTSPRLPPVFPTISLLFRAEARAAVH